MDSSGPDVELAAEDILAQYSASHSTYDAFTQTCHQLVSRLIEARNLRVHSITSRTKTRSSLDSKLRRGGRSYSGLAEITDLTGIRIITYFGDEVDRVAKVIEQEFEIDLQRSIDKRKALEPDRFGYLSVHYICKLSKARSKLTEYARFEQLACEIQIRTVLQHAWAEIEHDLGYKTALSVPQQQRRRFSRLAGLLETGDDEFMAIRDELHLYASEVAKGISVTPQSVLLDKVSLRAFMETDESVKQLDTRLAAIAGWQVARREEISGLLTELAYLNVRTIEDLKKLVSDHSELTVQQFERRGIKAKPGTSVGAGIGLFHMFQAVLARKGVAALEAAFEQLRIAPPGRRKAAVERIVAAVQDAERSLRDRDRSPRPT